MPSGLTLSAALLGTAALSGGGTGLLSIPSAQTMPDGSMQYSHTNGLLSADTSTPLGRRVSRQGQAVADQFIVGVAPFLEISGRLTSWYSKRTHGNHRDGLDLQDLQGHFKLQAYSDEQWAVSVGGRDVGGTSKGIEEAYFVVADYGWNDWVATLGYGKARQKGSALDGLFGGVRYTPYSWLSVMVDNDAVATQAGLQLSYTAPDRTYALFLKGYYTSNDYQRFAYTAGISKSLGRHNDRSSAAFSQSSLGRSQYWLGPVNDAMFQIDFADEWIDSIARTQALQAQYAGCLPNQTFHAYGVPLFKLACDENQSRLSWQTSWEQRPDPSNWHLAAKINPAFNYAVGTEVGRVDASVALRSTATLISPYGLSAYAVWDANVYDTNDYRPGKYFAGGSIPSGLNEFGFRYTAHIFPSVFVDLMEGKLGTTTGSREPFRSAKAAVFPFQGRLGLYYDWTDFYDLKGVTQKLAKAFVWLTPRGYALEFTRGQFLQGDKGYQAEIRRYVGRTIIGMYYKNSFTTGEEAAGVRVSISLSPSTAYGNKWVSLRGQSQAEFPLESQINRDDGTNALRPGFLFEMKPSSRFLRDTLDNWRVSPYYIDPAQ